jgi:hypothetical protein
MLYFVTSDKKEIAWHTREKCPLTFADRGNIIEVQADGDELEYIKNKFTNIPMSTNRVINWYGDIARFIASNMF